MFCVVNAREVFGAAVATLVFSWRGLVDYKLGVLLGAVMLLGGLVGGHISARLNNLWLRRIFLAVVLALAGKILIADVLLESWR